LNQQLLLPQFVTPKEVVRWMGAMQAQDFSAALHAICVRLPETSYEEAESAFHRGDFLRTHVLRPTWHLVAPEDIRWMLELTAPRIKAQTRVRDLALGLGETDFEKSNEVFMQALRGGRHLLREELAGVLDDAGIDVGGYRLSHFLMRAELDAVICSGAPRGKKQTYALLGERAPQAKRFNRETSLIMLAMRYFTSRGPATLKDFVWWSGLTTTEARQAILAVGAAGAAGATGATGATGNEIISADIEGQTYYFHLALQEEPFPSAQKRESSPNMAVPPETNHSPITVHHLPAFDEYLIAYADRTAMLAPEHTGKAIASNGIFRPTILHDGRIVGTWKNAGENITEDYFEKT
jgi:hypothetical protein